MMRVLRWFGLVVILAALGACATPQRIEGPGTAFERVGRFAVTNRPVNAPAQAAQGGFSWRDTGEFLRLDLVSPVGNVLAQIQVSPDSAVLVHSNGEREAAADPDSLLAKVWGHAVPVAGLRAWIQGRAQRGGARATLERDGQGRIVSLEQDGWRVSLSDYDDQGPMRVRLSRSDAQGQVLVQLVVNED